MCRTDEGTNAYTSHGNDRKTGYEYLGAARAPVPQSAKASKRLNNGNPEASRSTLIVMIDEPNTNTD